MKMIKTFLISSIIASSFAHATDCSKKTMDAVDMLISINGFKNEVADSAEIIGTGPKVGITTYQVLTSAPDHSSYLYEVDVQKTCEVVRILSVGAL